MINYNNNLPKQTLLWSELYSIGENNIIADADYIIDRSLDATQGQINNTLIGIARKTMSITYDAEFNEGDFLIKVFVYSDGQIMLSLPAGCSIKFMYRWANGDVSEAWNDIDYSSWKAGVNKSVLFSHNVGLSEPTRIIVRLVINDGHVDTIPAGLIPNNIILDQIIIDLINELQPAIVATILDTIGNKADASQVYTKTQVDNKIAEAAISGGDVNLALAAIEDILQMFYEDVRPAQTGDSGDSGQHPGTSI